MKLINFILVIFLILTNGIKANTETEILEKLKNGGNLIFIRHAYAPGGGDPENFDINDCSTQRNLDDSGRLQSKEIGNFFFKKEIPVDQVLSSEWCRCKETSEIAFLNFETKYFLNSFYSEKFQKNKSLQMKKLKNFINNWKSDKNLILVTHYVVILEALNYAPSSGEIVVSDKNFNLLGTIKIKH